MHPNSNVLFPNIIELEYSKYVSVRNCSNIQKIFESVTVWMPWYQFLNKAKFFSVTKTTSLTIPESLSLTTCPTIFRVSSRFTIYEFRRRLWFSKFQISFTHISVTISLTPEITKPWLARNPNHELGFGPRDSRRLFPLRYRATTPESKRNRPQVTLVYITYSEGSWRRSVKTYDTKFRSLKGLNIYKHSEIVRLTTDELEMHQ